MSFNRIHHRLSTQYVDRYGADDVCGFSGASSLRLMDCFAGKEKFQTSRGDMAVHGLELGRWRTESWKPVRCDKYQYFNQVCSLR